MTSKIRVFLCDDSAVVRLGLRRLLESDPELEVVGEASSGEAALEAVPKTRPDVVLMDLVLPAMDGLATTSALLEDHPWRILLVSDLVGREIDLNFRALAAGALDLVAKPGAEERRDPARARRFLRRVKLLAEVPMVTRRGVLGGPRTSSRPPPEPSAAGVELVAVGASTGGPPALLTLLSALAPAPPWPIVVVQHIAPGFVAGMATWLAESSGLPVEIAVDGVRPRPGVTYLAPDDLHLELPGKLLALRPRPPERGHRPSVDALFRSLATSRQAPATAAVLLTGMGDDGAGGLLTLRRAGALTIVQDPADAVVDGMPAAAIALGAAAEVLPLAEIGPRLLALGGPLAAPRGIL